MSIGTSIFLSAILLGIIALFITTKDRWNWKKIVVWLASVILFLSGVSGVGVWIYSFISERPHAQTTFWDIPIEATKGDVKFLKGEPTITESDNIWIYDLKKKSNVVSGLDLLYDRGKYRVSFKGDKLWASSYSGFPSDSPGIQGLDIGATQEAIVDKFGTPSYVSVSEDDLEKILSYRGYNVFFSLRQNKVYAFGMFNPKFEPMKCKKEKAIETKKDES